jgi:fibronectin type 3 domain-containing protein
MPVRNAGPSVQSRRINLKRLHHILPFLTALILGVLVVSAVMPAGAAAGDNIPHFVPTIPPAPAGLTATAGDTQVQLTWTTSSGATVYRVRRGTTSGGPYTTIASVTSTFWANVGLTNGTTYFYVVAASNAVGTSPNSPQASATPAASTPPAPTGVLATRGDAKVTVTWNASAGATSYNVKRATVNGGPYTTVASPAGTTYADTGLTNGTTYYYVVTAVNAAGESANSAQVSGKPIGIPDLFSAVPNDTKVTLQWWAVTGASGYRIRRSLTAGGPYKTIRTVTGIECIDTDVTNGTAYYYVVAAFDNVGDGPNTTEKSATPAVPTVKPPSPSPIWGKRGDGQVALGWRASEGATSYNVKRSTASPSFGGTFTTITSPTGTSFTDTGLTYGVTYYYVVSAKNSFGESADSGDLSFKILGPPTGVTATAGNAKVTLAWNANTDATGFRVRRATAAGGPYSTVASVSGTTWTNAGLTNGTTYYYVVAAFDSTGDSANSTQVSATPSP